MNFRQAEVLGYKWQGWLCFLVLVGLAGCQTAPMPTAVLAVTSTVRATAAATQTPTPLPAPSSTIPNTLTTEPVPAAVVMSTPSATVTILPAPPTATPPPKLYATIDVTAYPPGTAVPSPVTVFAKADHIVNIVLLGNDVATPQGGRTDSLILVSINQATETATMLSLPRDLFVVIPGWQMTRINLALPHGHGVNYPGGGGGLIKDTIEYNLGIPVDYYARIGFNGFKEAVDAVGGIEMVVNCGLTDWRLISPELDPEVEENWEQFTLPPGVHAMDGDLALWFARSRRSSNDFERGLRQQRILQAIFRQSLDSGLLAQLPDLWQAYQQNIETDMSLPLLLELAAMAPAIAENGIRHLTLPLAALQPWRDPATGGAVQLLQWQAAEATLDQLMQLPALNRAAGPGLTVAVVTDDEILYQQMADNLTWYGFAPLYEAAEEPIARTEIVYYGRNRKGAYDWLLSWLFHQETAEITTIPDQTSDVVYRVWLGQDANPCLNYLQAPNAGSE